ncbi:hypothetical protein [Campylobacter sp.]|nr:hypothetical protein [Campylobacter sp.]
MSETNCYQSLKAQSFTSLSLVWLRQLEDRIYIIHQKLPQSQ